MSARDISKAANFLVPTKGNVNLSNTKSVLYAQNHERTEDLKIFHCRFFSLEICDRTNVVINNSVAFEETSFSFVEQV